MSSHREAPAISTDPVADNTDVYAFVSPDRPDTVTLIANFIPLEEPAGGPNFFRFGDDVLYEIHIDNDGDGHEDVTFDFRFTTRVMNPATFLYNVGPISSLTDPNWNVRQTYEVGVTRDNGRGRKPRTVAGRNLATPPVNIGPRSTPDYEALAKAAIHSLPDGVRVFAGQRDEGFFVDLGSIFDLGTLRPVQMLHLIPSANAMGEDGAGGYNVHSIAIQVPISMITADGKVPTDVMAAGSTIGVWATASRQRVTLRTKERGADSVGPWVQVSRLGNPLINEVVIPLGKKDDWNGAHPSRDSQFASHYAAPELAALLPVLYPGVFPRLGALTESGASRDDLVAILLTGIPGGLVDGFQNFTGTTQADMLRLNVAIPPTGTPSPLGLIGGDAAGFPNGRRVFDDVVAIELRAVAGAVYPLIDSTFEPDAAAGGLADGTSNDRPYLTVFPYLGTPHQGYEHTHH
ncbi:MAG: DUF4331 domain-containing protein [Dehalococcoidia bacterium]